MTVEYWEIVGDPSWAILNTFLFIFYIYLYINVSMCVFAYVKPCGGQRETLKNWFSSSTA